MKGHALRLYDYETTGDPSEAGEGVDTESLGRESARPEWLPQNFESPEQLVSSYRELQGRFTQTAQERAAYEQQLQQMQQAQGPEPDYSEQLQEAYEQNPLETMAWVAQQAAEAATKKYEQQMLPAQVDVVAQQAKNMIAAKYPDFAQLETQVAQILQDDPGLVDPKAGYSLDATARTYERAYQLAAAQQWRAAQDQAATMAAQGRSDKLGVQTVSGAGGRPDVAGPESDDDYFERLRAAGRPTYGSLASRATQT